jgi:formylglycine-generating enzyme required for sulfatase activity
LAHYFLPSSDEWYKAAYYDPDGQSYFDFPTGSDSAPTPTLGGTTPGTAVYLGSLPTDEVYQQLLGPAKITQAGGLSPYGTMGQAGNIFEWKENDGSLLNDTVYLGHGVRGGFWFGTVDNLKSTYRDFADIDFKWPALGFRVASVVPEPSTLFMTIVVVTMLGTKRQRSARLK